MDDLHQVLSIRYRSQYHHAKNWQNWAEVWDQFCRFYTQFCGGIFAFPSARAMLLQ